MVYVSLREDGDDGLPTHTGDDHGVRLLRCDTCQAVAQAEAQALHAVLRRGAAGVCQRLTSDVRGNGALYTPSLQQPYRQITVVGADVRQPAALRHHVCQQLQPRL